MINNGSFVASNYLSPKPPLQVPTGVAQGGYVRVVNNSPYLLNLNFQGMGSYTMPEMYLEDFFVPVKYLGEVTIIPSVNLTSTSRGTSNLITVTTWSPGELPYPQSVSISQQAVNVTATGKPIFSASVGFGSTATVQNLLNIYNPPTSGVVMTFHSARGFSNDTTTPTLSLTTSVGSDNNASGGSVSAICHSCQANPPVSVAHCTFQDALDTFPNFVDIEILDNQTSITLDIIAFPDLIILYPGNNLWIEFTSGTTGHIVRFTMKWTEDTIVPPSLLTGATAVAQSIINDVNVAGTQIIEARPTGDSSSAVILTNAGIETLGDTSNHGKLTVSGVSGNNTVLNADGVSAAVDLSASTLSTGLLKLLTGSLTRVSHGTTAVVTTGTAITHGLGTTPDLVLATVDNAATAIAVACGSLTATQFTAIVGTNANVFWVAIKF